MSVDTSNCGRNKIIEVVVSTNQGMEVWFISIGTFKILQCMSLKLLA
jgi:hypothetical protein